MRWAAFLTKPVKQSQMFNVLAGIFADEAVMVRAPGLELSFDETMAQRLPLRILLVEDNSVNQKLALRMLRRMGYRADVAGNGLEGIQSIERQEYDVVLMDVQMPEMDGLEASRRICARWPREHRPRIIAMTANALHGDREICVAAGMDDYVSKPVRVEELVGALSRCPPRSWAHAASNGHGAAEQGAGNGALPSTSHGPPGDGALIADENGPALDAATMTRLRDSMGAEFLPELIETFVSDSEKLLADLQRGVAGGNAELVRRSAHTLKSHGGTLGAGALAGLCAELESLGKAGALAEAGDLVQRAASERERVKDALDLIRNGDVP